MSDVPAFCPYCGKPAVTEAAFCAYCGSALHREPEAAEPVQRSVPVPGPSDLEGPCTVFYTGQQAMNVRRVGRLVADTTGKPLPDVTREMRTCRRPSLALRVSFSSFCERFR